MGRASQKVRKSICGGLWWYCGSPPQINECVGNTVKYVCLSLCCMLKFCALVRLFNEGFFFSTPKCQHCHKVGAVISHQTLSYTELYVTQSKKHCPKCCMVALMKRWHTFKCGGQRNAELPIRPAKVWKMRCISCIYHLLFCRCDTFALPNVSHVLLR